MKFANIFSALTIALALAVVSNTAHAGSVDVASGATVGGLSLYEFVLDATGMEGAFDTVELVVEGGPINQTDSSGGLVTQPSEDSGYIDFLTAPKNFGGQALSAFGVDAGTDTDNGISGTFASLGSNDASDQGSFTLAQVTAAAGVSGTYRYEFFDDGASVGAGNGIWGIPEPTSLILAGLGLIGFVGTRRRS